MSVVGRTRDLPVPVQGASTHARVASATTRRNERCVVLPSAEKSPRHRPPASPDPSLDSHCAARHDGALLLELIDRNNTAGDVWADTAHRSKANEKFLADRLLRSQIHCKKPKDKPMPRHTARANARKSAVRSAVEHVFARQKGPMGLFIRTIAIARARTKIGLANLTYNMQRLIWLTGQAAPA
jgi:hypothetical protein